VPRTKANSNPTRKSKRSQQVRPPTNEIDTCFAQRDYMAATPKDSYPFNERGITYTSLMQNNRHLSGKQDHMRWYHRLWYT
jgi:hypothetical protein